MTDIDIDAIREKWLNQCGACDAGLPMGCSHPDGDYRPVIAALLATVDELTADLDRLTREHVEANTELTQAWAALNRAGFQSPVDGIAALIDLMAAALAEARATANVRQGQLAKSREQAATYANEIGRLTAENARVRQQRDNAAEAVTR